MITRRKLCPLISSILEKSQPCFCWRAMKQQRMLRTYLSAENPINGEANLSPPKFYQRLNCPKNILAPMVAQSDLPFRLMCEQLYNVDLSYTQMIHAYNFIKPGCETFRTNHLDVYPHSITTDVLFGNHDREDLIVTPSQIYAMKGIDHHEIEAARSRILSVIAKSKGIHDVSELKINTKPTVVQIAAHDPDVAVEAAMVILERSGSMNSYNNGDTCTVAGIDLNLGCPQSIARKGRYGSFLHDEHPDLTYKVLQKLRSVLPQHIGVTAKIRLPPTQADADAGRLGSISSLESGPQTIDERMRCLIDCGVDLITVHGRTRFENKVAVGVADWESVRQCVESARTYSGDANFPIISNGGIEFGEDVQKCFGETNASGVMSSEGILELPSLFRSGEEEIITAKLLLERQLGFAELYLDYATIFPPLPGSLGTKGGSFNVIRSHLFKFLHRYLEENPDLRSLLGKQEVNTIKQSRDLVSELKTRYCNLDEEQLRMMKSWDKESSWYRRHRGTNIQPARPSEMSLEERKHMMKMRLRKRQTIV
ncbi:hypothetical protein ACHAWU_002118 [Discostella pseudostelligera]|uniref:tRNA-dihydrouridine(16/17) synthase [NAD(P)(+)] n=1 Tax=Discostella pseudostelligera TaxID=259834 RepID=A0ABD3MIN5_9STRA